MYCSRFEVETIGLFSIQWRRTLIFTYFILYLFTSIIIYIDCISQRDEITTFGYTLAIVLTGLEIFSLSISAVCMEIALEDTQGKKHSKDEEKWWKKTLLCLTLNDTEKHIIFLEQV